MGWWMKWWSFLPHLADDDDDDYQYIYHSFFSFYYYQSSVINYCFHFRVNYY